MAPKATSHDAGKSPPLLSGPLEIRTTIYKEVLQGTAFVVDTPIPLCTQAYMRLTPAGKKRLLPDLLRVSKQIRAEALPVFSNTIEPLFGYFTFRLLHPMNIPDHYFTHTCKVYISDYVGNYVPLSQMPMLETLVLERRQLAKTPHHVSWELMRAEDFNVATFLIQNPLWSKYARLYESFCNKSEAETHETAESRSSFMCTSRLWRSQITDIL